jgi:aryl-alcohol dehydrogenase-like predicted oxidoreductase
MLALDPSKQDRAVTLAHMEEVLEAADQAVKAGKIRHFALSNDSAWGTAQWLRLAEARGCRGCSRSRTNIRCCAVSMTPIMASWR